MKGVDGGEEEEEEGKISPMCESIGHRPLRGRCPKSMKEKRKRKTKREKEKDEQKKKKKKAI